MQKNNKGGILASFKRDYLSGKLQKSCQKRIIWNRLKRRCVGFRFYSNILELLKGLRYSFIFSNFYL